MYCTSSETTHPSRTRSGSGPCVFVQGVNINIKERVLVSGIASFEVQALIEFSVLRWSYPRAFLDFRYWCIAF
jgi:hypothetical protein